ncbi:MAG: family 16 glycoside hydrolase [Planctomycetaceae bacterium]
MSRVILVMCLLAGVAVYVHSQFQDVTPLVTSSPVAIRSVATEADASDPAPAPPAAAPAWNGTTPAAAIASPEWSPASSATTVTTTGESTTTTGNATGVRQTAFFESSEALPPGVDYPEGSTVVQTAEVDAPRPIDATSLPRAVPQLMTPPEKLSLTEQPLAEDLFEPLFNGTDLVGWAVQDGKPEGWSVVDGALKCTRANGGWLRTSQTYSDFVFRVDVRLSPGANTGIAFRFPDQGSPTLTGFEVQLIDDTAAKYVDLRPDQHSGSLYYQLPPLDEYACPVNEWFPVEIEVRGPHIRVSIDGGLINDIYLDQLPAGEHPHPLLNRPLLGHLGLQSSASPVEFRNPRIHELGNRLDSGLKTLDLTTGTGDVCPTEARITVDYRGLLVDGKTFDSSYDRGESLTVALSDVIDGWQAGIPGMREGGRRKLIVPAALAYGDAGVKDLVPPGATLVFEVELRRIER